MGTKEDGRPVYETFYYDMQQGHAYICDNCVINHWERKKSNLKIFLGITIILELFFLFYYITSTSTGALFLLVLGTIMLIGGIAR